MLIFAVLVILPTLTLAQSVSPHLLDANKDGQITLLETEAYFLARDADNDGEITKEEFTAAVDTVDPAFIGKEGFLFQIFDKDSNGKINKADIDSAFKVADMNKDNYISKLELETLIKLVKLGSTLIG